MGARQDRVWASLDSWVALGLLPLAWPHLTPWVLRGSNEITEGEDLLFAKKQHEVVTGRRLPAPLPRCPLQQEPGMATGAGQGDSEGAALDRSPPPLHQPHPLPSGPRIEAGMPCGMWARCRAGGLCSGRTQRGAPWREEKPDPGGGSWGLSRDGGVGRELTARGAEGQTVDTSGRWGSRH